MSPRRARWAAWVSRPKSGSWWRSWHPNGLPTSPGRSIRSTVASSAPTSSAGRRLVVVTGYSPPGTHLPPVKEEADGSGTDGQAVPVTSPRPTLSAATTPSTWHRSKPSATRKPPWSPPTNSSAPPPSTEVWPPRTSPPERSRRAISGSDGRRSRAAATPRLDRRPRPAGPGGHRWPGNSSRPVTIAGALVAQRCAPPAPDEPRRW